MDHAEGIAREFVDSLVMGVGQFCTNPGLVIALEGEDCDRFEAEAGRAVQGKPAGTMLTPGIGRACAAGVSRLQAYEAVRTVATGESGSGGVRGGRTAHLFATDAASFLAFPKLGEEIFGPCSLIVRLPLGGGHGGGARRAGEATDRHARRWRRRTRPSRPNSLPQLEDRAGRIRGERLPDRRGSESRHGRTARPFPAARPMRAARRSGSAAIERFLRPVCLSERPIPPVAGRPGRRQPAGA
ncbi:hypothetical protein ACU4GD_18165 [Cupriavidus basilensis]